MYFTTDSGSSNNDVKLLGSSEAIGGAYLGSFEMTLMAGVLKYWSDLQAPSMSASDLAFNEQKKLFGDIPPLLLQQYRGQFVASRNGQIVDSDPDLDSLVQRFFTRYGEVQAYITRIGGKMQEYLDSPF